MLPPREIEPTAGGAGLGLSIAKWIADAHQAGIDASSVPEAGSVFRVRLLVLGNYGSNT